MTVVAQPLSRLLIRLKSVSILTCVDPDKPSLCLPMVIEEICEKLLESLFISSFKLKFSAAASFV